MLCCKIRKKSANDGVRYMLDRMNYAVSVSILFSKAYIFPKVTIEKSLPTRLRKDSFQKYREEKISNNNTRINMYIIVQYIIGFMKSFPENNICVIPLFR